MFFQIIPLTRTFSVIPLLIRVTFSAIKTTFIFAMIYVFLIFFDLSISVIMLKTSRLTSSVLFGTHSLLDKSLRVLQLLTQLSKLTVNG